MSEGFYHTVVSGEYLSLIAQRHGLTWMRLWEAPENAALRDARKSPNILYPGDSVYVPVKEPGEESGSTGQKHRFRVKGTPQRIRLRIRDDFGNPVPDLAYSLQIPGCDPIEGTTGGDGLLEERVPVDAQRAELLFTEIGTSRVLEIGNLEPISTNKGVQQRLRNLGFDPGPIDGIVGPLTRSAISRFQSWAGLPVSGNLDQETRDRLEEEHEGMNRGLEPEEPAEDADSVGEAGEEASAEDPRDEEELHFDEGEEED